MEKQHWRISVKGYHPQIFRDSSIGSRHDGTSYQDTIYGYGYVFFHGTEDECDTKEMELFKAGFKILGSESWEPDEAGKELKRRVKELSDKAYKKFRDLVDYNDTKLPPVYFMGRLQMSGRNYTEEERRLKAVADRIWSYYINKFVKPYL